MYRKRCSIAVGSRDAGRRIASARNFTHEPKNCPSKLSQKTPPQQIRGRLEPDTEGHSRQPSAPSVNSCQGLVGEAAHS